LVLIFERDAVIAKNQKPPLTPATVCDQMKDTAALQKPQSGQLDVSQHRTRPTKISVRESAAIIEM
jgi:hypothetical protein